MKLLLILGVIVECVILILLTALKKWTKKTFLIISACTCVCCGVFGIIGALQKFSEDAADQRSYLYIATRLIQEDYPEKTLEVLSYVSDEETADLNSLAIRALAYNLNEAYETVEKYLSTGDGSEEGEIILEASQARQKVDEETQDRITENTLQVIDATEAETRKWEAEMRVRYMGFQLNEEEKAEIGSGLEQVKEAISENRYEDAYNQLVSGTGNGDVKNAVIISGMYVKNYNHRIMSDTDTEYAYLWNQAVSLQAELNMAVASLPDDASDEEYQEYMKAEAQYDMALEALSLEAVSRAVNYLEAIDMSDSGYKYGYQLQLARLYFMANRLEEAKGCLEKIFTSDSLNETQWLGRELILFRDAFIGYLSNSVSREHSVLFSQLMGSLYQSVFPEDNYGTFEEFVYAYLRDLFGGLIIRRVDVTDFPQVTVEASVTKEGLEITENSITVADTGESIQDFSVENIEVTDLSMALVLDRSGSMEGNKLTESKNALRNCIFQMEDNVSLSFVTFESTALLECGLTDSRYLVMGLVEDVQTTGGTNIAEGLSCALDSLRGANGTKVVVLLSDGVDGDESRLIIDSILAEAAAEHIAVYTIGLEGCDEEYLQNISEQTGGQFIMVTSTAELNETYQEIQSAVANNYLISYRTVQEGEERSVTLREKSSFTEARKTYSTVEEEAEMPVYENEMQEANYFKQIGGTGR